MNAPVQTEQNSAGAAFAAVAGNRARPVNGPTCPLTGSSEVEILETIRTADLVTIYRRAFKIDVASEFGDLQEIRYCHATESDLRFFYPAVIGSADFYERLPVCDDCYYLKDKSEYQFARRIISESDAVLDVGCGTANFARQTRCREYVGLELSRSAQALAAETGRSVWCETVEQHALTNSGRYDVVCAFQVLEHVVHLRSFIEACIACLKPGGHLIYAVPSVDSFARDAVNHVLDLPPHHVTRWSDKALGRLAQHFCLEIVEIWHEPLSSMHHQFYAATVLNAKLRRWCGMELPLVDTSALARVLAVSSKAAGRITRDVPAWRFGACGVSVVAVLRKPTTVGSAPSVSSRAGDD